MDISRSVANKTDGIKLTNYCTCIVRLFSSSPRVFNNMCPILSNAGLRSSIMILNLSAVFGNIGHILLKTLCKEQNNWIIQGGWLWVVRGQVTVKVSYHTFRRVLSVLRTGPWFNIKMSSYQYRKSHCGDKTVVRSSYLHNGISYAGKMSSLYWFSPLASKLSGLMG